MKHPAKLNIPTCTKPVLEVSTYIFQSVQFLSHFQLPDMFFLSHTWKMLTRGLFFRADFCNTCDGCKLSNTFLCGILRHTPFTPFSSVLFSEFLYFCVIKHPFWHQSTWCVVFSWVFASKTSLEVLGTSGADLSVLSGLFGEGGKAYMQSLISVMMGSYQR